MDSTETQLVVKRGTQVIYVPSHAKWIDHPDCEVGFVTKAELGWYFVRYFYPDGTLRTTANSERTPACAVVVQDTYPQSKIDTLLKELGY